MDTNNKKPMLTEAQRTVIFTEEQAKAICYVMDGFDPHDVALALDEVVQQLLNNVDKIESDIGNHYYTLRLLKDMHIKIAPAFRALQKAFANTIINGGSLP